MDCISNSSINEHVKKALDAYQTDGGTGPEIIQQAILNTWAGTFIYQFFIEDAHLRQSVIDFVCKHRPGTNPRLGNPYRYDSYNFNIEIIFDDGIALFRFPIPGIVVYPDDKVKAEVATIRYVADYTTIPVPHIHHWGTAEENPTGLKVPFMIMDHIAHATTVDQALEDPEFKIPSIPESMKREYLYQKMAEISLQLYKLTSDRIGSLGILDNGDYAVTSAPLSHNMAYHVVNCSVPVSVLPPCDKTYCSSTEYLTDAANMGVAGLLFMNEKFTESATDCRDQFVARCLTRDIVRRRQNSSCQHIQTGPDTATQNHQTHETFRLWGDDLGPENVLLDENGAVVGVVDWEYTYFAPETYLANPPWWLLLEVVEKYAGEDREPNTSDSGQLSHDAEDERDEQGDRKYQAPWDDAVKTYLRALEKAEETLQSDKQDRHLGNHLCSGSSKDEAVAAHIAQPVTLSQLMRHRWNEDIKEYALTTLASRSSLQDIYFWGCIDKSVWGENATGGHEDRLGLLNAPSRMLMEWFVYRRVEEIEAWDPKLLLDQVLQQMDGNSLVLLVHDNPR